MDSFYPFVLTPLPYSYDALEPYIDARTMQVHHQGHMGNYVKQLNLLLKDYSDLHSTSLEQLLAEPETIPREICRKVLQNGGGIYNHRIYFDGMTPDSSGNPVGALAAAIDKEFGSFDEFKKIFSQAAMDVFGSGYVWLAVDEEGSLVILVGRNQETPLAEGFCPILNLDVWEHAYYLKHTNQRVDYIQDWFAVIDWEKAERRYEEIMEVRHIT